MSSKYLIIAGALLVLPNAHSAEPTSCQVPTERRSGDTALSALGDPASNAIILEAGEFQAQLGDQPSASMSGGVTLQHGDRLFAADAAQYDTERRALFLEGDVRFEDSGTHVRSDSAEFSYAAGRVRFEGARFSLDDSTVHGAADAIEINQQGRLELDGVSYTTCPPESNDWLLEAREIVIDTRKGVATAKGIKLRFQGVPILYSPYLSFPIGEARKSGILTPQIGSTDRAGNEISLPIYWNIAPNYDAKITPRLLTDRGLQINAQFRYLTDTSTGRVDAEYMSSDSMFNDSRQLLSLQHRTMFLNGWRGRIDYRDVSDIQYFEDLGGSLSMSSITHLDRTFSFDYQTDTLSFFAQVQDYQTLDIALAPGDEGIAPDEEPYRRVPQLLARGSWPDRWLGLHFKFDGELVNFDRDVGVTGWRLNLAPEIQLPIKRPGWFITPAIALDHTQYALSDTLPGAPTDPKRTVPIGSLDIGMTLERSIKSASGAKIQTLEPRLLYVHIPHRDQDDLPVFDTITPDLNLVSLYRKNRYLGIDRIADTDQLSFGITSRILRVSNGRELVSATLGQTRYLSESGVSLPGQTVATTVTSDYIAELSFSLLKSINFDIGHQWGRDSSGRTQSRARLQYSPARNKILNLAYRFRRDSLEQGDVSWSWPIGTKWNFIGRYKFSFLDDKVLEQFYGLEYESCCWGLRIVTRRFISKRDGTRDSSIGVQLVLKGMSSIGTAADKMLERGILGYSANRR